MTRPSGNKIPGLDEATSFAFKHLSEGVGIPPGLHAPHRVVLGLLPRSLGVFSC